jgi:galactofuranose transport system permease protein
MINAKYVLTSKTIINYVFAFIKENRAFSFLVVFIIMNTIITPNFFDAGTLRNLMLQVFPILIVALGMTLVIATGGIDISVGAIMAIAASTVTMLFDKGVPLLASILIGLFVAALCGLFNGILISKFEIQPIIVTLILLVSGRGLAQIILGDLMISFYGSSYAALGSMRLFGFIPIQVIIMILFILVIYLIVNNMGIGKKIIAIGDSKKAARLSGINVTGVLIFVYVACAVLAGVAGIMETSRINSINAGKFGILMELDAIAATALGGTSFNGGKVKVIGTVMGALIMSLITITVNMNNIPYNYSLLLKAIIIIIMLISQKENTG